MDKAYFAKDHLGQLLCEKWQANSTSDYIFSGGIHWLLNYCLLVMHSQSMYKDG